MAADSPPKLSQKRASESTSTFTVDSREITGTQFVPSVSKLLNRRKLERAEDKTSVTRILPAGVVAAAPTQKTPTQTPMPSVSEPAMLIPFERPAAPAPNSTATSARPVVKTVKKRAVVNIAALTAWDPQHLAQAQDPLAHGLLELIKIGATDAVFLAITAPPAGARVPHFTANAGLGKPERLQLWRGVIWDPAVAPAAWNAFLKTGVVELSPPGATTQQSSERNILRTALGANSSEYLLIVRVGPPAGCRGALMVLSRSPLMPALTKALAYLHAPAGVVAPKAA